MSADPDDAAHWLALVRDAERRGELLDAHDLAEQGLARHPDDWALKFRAVLALARAGSTEQAAERYERYGLAGVGDEDTAALQARIAKDLALAAAGDDRARAAQRSAELYAAIHRRTGGYFPAVNAATLSLVAGQVEQSRHRAAEVMNDLRRSPEESYYAWATMAEAALLLGDLDQARLALSRAVALADGDHGAMSTTRRQLRLICALTGVHVSVLDALTPPGVVHFCGHLIAAPGRPGRFPAAVEPAVAAAMAAVVEASGAGWAYGALASGADILWAEALLAHGVELRVVLPFAQEEFVRESVAAAGAGWVERFRSCLDAAGRVDFATDGAYLGDDVLFRYGTELAMGLAVQRARDLDTSVTQLALWDGAPAAGEAGTAIDVATWRQRGLPSTVIAVPATPALGTAPTVEIAPTVEPAPPPTPAPVSAARPRRVVRAMLFADVKGFSKLTDEQLSVFAGDVLTRFAQVLDRHGESVQHQNTWGDAVYVVLRDVVDAASCAIELQAAMASVDLAAVGLPEHLALRLGGHVGPVFPVHDPVLDKLAFMGAHVSRTARIEPVTPPGTVYVTEQFAAALALRSGHDYRCDYVGHMPAAKEYGRLRMYRLRHAVLPTPAADRPDREEPAR